MNPLDLRRTDLPRKNFITSTDMMSIVLGNLAELAGHKRNGTEPNLGHVFKVQLGKATEKFHADWHLKTSCDDGVILLPIDGLILPDEKRRLPGWVASSYDFYLMNGPNTVLETKHTNARASFREKAVYYQPQLQWQMLVTGAKSMRFSCIFGNDEPTWGTIEADPVLQEMLLERAEEFRGRVLSGETIQDAPADKEVVAAAAKVKIDGKVAYDFTKNNAWLAGEQTFINARALEKRAKAAVAEFKALVPDDAAEITGKLVSMKRSKSGSILFTIDDTAEASAGAFAEGTLPIIKEA